MNFNIESSEIINLSAFGGKFDTVRKIETTTLKLQTIKGHELAIKVVIFDKISTLIKTPSFLQIEEMRHLKWIKIKYPVVENPLREFMEIDVLISSDYYWSIVERVYGKSSCRMGI